MSTTCTRGQESGSRSSRLFSARDLNANGLLAPNTSHVERLRRFVQRHATEAIADTAQRLETRGGRVYEEVEGKKVFSTDCLLGRGKTCPVGQRMRLLNKIAVALDLPEVYPGLKDLDASVA